MFLSSGSRVLAAVSVIAIVSNLVAQLSLGFVLGTVLRSDSQASSDFSEIPKIRETK